MFVGHLAAAIAAGRVQPRAPLGVLVGAAFALDLIWPVLLLAGIEMVRIDPGNTAFTPLAFDYYPWSHSLSMAVVWAVVVGRVSAAVLRHTRAGLVIGLTVLSHWVLDCLTHRPDLPLWPGGPNVGLGLWNSIPSTIVVEGTLFAAAVLLYARATRAGDAVGKWAFLALVAVATAIWLSGPFSPPPPSATAVAAVALALWLLPFWAQWIERHRVTR
ncbi:MAG TPA: hypothetical protein VIX63_08410 [Vicinamibacterales bacterium]